MYKEIFDKITASDELRQKIEERIDSSMNTKKRFSVKVAVLAACLVLALSLGSFAAYRYLTASQAVKEMGDSTLALNFENGKEMNVTAEEAPYRATLLGTCSGAGLSDLGGADDEIYPERTYAVMAIERTDGQEVTYDDNIMISPLIQGLDPMRYSIFSLDGSSTGKIIGGVLYRVVECDSIECLADRQIYLAVYEGLAPNSAYSMDAATGEIRPKADYDGVNMLLNLDLDPAKADPVKAQALIDRADNRMSGADGGDIGDGEESEVAEDEIREIRLVEIDSESTAEKGFAIEKK